MSMIGPSWNDIPGIGSTLETLENQIWWGLRQQQKVMPAVLLSTTIDAGNTPTTLLRAGLLLGYITSTKKWTIWSPTATNGSQIVKAILLWSQEMSNRGTAVDKWYGYALVGGNIKAASLLVPGETTFGLAGKTYEYLIRAQLTASGRFIIDDQLEGSGLGGWNHIWNRATDLTVTAAEHDTLFTNLGAVAAVNFTLPAPLPGLRFGFYAAADFSLTVTAAAVGQMIIFNDAAANSVAYGTAGDIIGGMFEVIGISSSKWMVIPHNWADGVLVQTITVAT